jgi:hypothetical protein
MNDTVGRIYDSETAVHFIHKLTGIDVDVVTAALTSRDRYALGLGIICPEDAWDEHDPSAIRASAPALFPPQNIMERFVNTNLERVYIVMDSGVDAAVVREIIAADEEYMRRLGIIE